MSLKPARLMGLFLLTLFLNSPFFLIPYFFLQQSPMISPLTDNPILLHAFEHQPPSPKESQFAILIAASPHPEVLAAKVIKGVAEESKPQTEDHSPSPSRSFTIAVLGDSMIDVMQPDLPQLKSALQKYYPEAQFKLLNYGVGASNIEYGLERLTSDYTYLGKNFPSLLFQNPDIIVIESFAYNHWDNNQAGLDRQWLTLAGIINTVKNSSQAKVVLAATIGPDETTLCDGIDGINLPPDQKREKAQAIRAYLQNLVNFATSQGYPLADAYHSSLDNNGNSLSFYINQADHLHPSGPGGELFSQKIAETIYQYNLL